jgi:hypothetical protein
MSDPSPNFLTKRHLGLAGVAALLGCMAACSIPLLAAAGFGGGVFAALAARFHPGSELVVGGTMFLVMLAAMALRRRLQTRRPGRARRGLQVGGCSCETSSKSTRPLVR